MMYSNGRNIRIVQKEEYDRAKPVRGATDDFFSGQEIELFFATDVKDCYTGNVFYLSGFDPRADRPLWVYRDPKRPDLCFPMGIDGVRLAAPQDRWQAGD